MQDYKIRLALPGDLDGVYKVFSLADHIHRQAHPEIFQKAADPSGIKHYLLAGIQTDDAVVFIAEDQDEIVGAVIAVIRHTPELQFLVQRSYVSIENLVVAEKYRRLGVGKTLMESVHFWAQENGFNQIQLTVWDFNQEAKTFYNKMGYEMLNHKMRMVLP